MDLRTAVMERARIEGNLVLVDEFLNHRVEPAVIASVGRSLATAFADLNPDLILTAEASGIPPAMACSHELGIPMVYAKKYLGTGDRYSFAREVTSPTKGVEYRVEVARRVLPPGLRLIIIDDFLARGRTAEALGEIAIEAGCDLLGFGFAIEKTWQAGRERLERHGWVVHSVVELTAIEGSSVVIKDDG
ncbi:MAG: phosphoribosyltransferase family protein [Acidimicrobiia bacterium]|nr:phosphoribosyltransferase family protein [Acidimicrobiia bacterium]